MYRVLQMRRHALIVATVAMAFSLSACGGSSPTVAPTTEPSTATAQPTDTASPTTAPVTGLAGARIAMTNLTSYKFTMTLVGAVYPDTLSSLLDNAGSGPVKVNGTIVLKPAPAADVNFDDLLRIISVGGNDYVALDPAQGYTMNAQATADPSASPAATQPPTMSDAITPTHEFTVMSSSLKGFDMIGTENKNGVDCDHYQGSASALAEFGSISGVKGATWTADIWIATNGGYPISVSVIAKAKDGSTAYQISFDLTNVNDPANSVKVPDNVTGA